MIADYVLKVIKQFNKAGFSIELVGGSVRNILMKQAVNDWDLTTSALPE